MVMLHIKQVRSCDKSIYCPVCVYVSLSQHLEFLGLFILHENCCLETHNGGKGLCSSQYAENTSQYAVSIHPCVCVRYLEHWLPGYTSIEVGTD